ncbi:hypothetical protein SBF1_1470004 [Candidatus Desulfosporosinus infrequens]|uniref:Uncharacterized protein n=1 Tax=Candidatus Desulfosporosinus infrequens TaxID=2043169 RepID=A0A2U3K6F7_9FIRM|nr:hypothetical protein SBF1_1470004 [Candidatus Desulfosporosinus infrequens]
MFVPMEAICYPSIMQEEIVSEKKILLAYFLCIVKTLTLGW